MGRVRKLFTLCVVLGAASLGAWTHPEAPSSAARAADPALRLDYVLVEVNGKPHALRDGEELAVVKGDRILVKEAGLRDPKLPIKEVNVVGFQAPKGGNDDRGFAFDSAKDLKPKFSEGGKGEVYAVTAGAKGVLYGAVFLRLIAPTLRYAELSINGKPVTLRDGEPLTVRGADKVKVERVVTNLDSHAGVMFQMSAIDAAQGAYAIRFTRDGLAFATIPLTVKE